MMNVEFKEQMFWSLGLKGVGIYALVDGERVGCVFEGRAIAEYFGVENQEWPIKVAFMQNRAFLEQIAREAIERGMVDRFGGVLLGKDELLPYFKQRDATLARA